jgi:uncharacterized protein (DUF1697 family)
VNTYIVLLRGINVGGKNKVSMADLRVHLEQAGYKDVTTYINSGNVLLRSSLAAASLGTNIEALLSDKFELDSSIIKVLVLTVGQLQEVIDAKPEGFGDQPDTYHSDAIFLMGIGTADALSVFSPKEGVDRVWPGKGVIYSERVSALRTKSRLGRIVGTPAYKSMTIRNWRTTTKLLELGKQYDQ